MTKLTYLRKLATWAAWVQAARKEQRAAYMNLHRASAAWRKSEETARAMYWKWMSADRSAPHWQALKNLYESAQRKEALAQEKYFTALNAAHESADETNWRRERRPA